MVVGDTMKRERRQRQKWLRTEPGGIMRRVGLAVLLAVTFMGHAAVSDEAKPAEEVLLFPSLNTDSNSTRPRLPGFEDYLVCTDGWVVGGGGGGGRRAGVMWLWPHPNCLMPLARSCLAGVVFAQDADAGSSGPGPGPGQSQS